MTERRRTTNFSIDEWPLDLNELPCLLTPTEMQVLRGAARGEDSETTGRHMGISVHTVKQHRSNIIRRLNAANITHVVALASFAGWLKEPDVRRSRRRRT